MSKSTVLYVEDEESDPLFVRMAFKKAGLDSSVLVVENGRDAIEYLSGAGPYAERSTYPLPKLVLLDLNLPVLPGFEVLKWMRQQPQYKSTPAIVFSSSSREQDKETARELGADDYLEKPSSIDGFVGIARLLEKWLG